MKPSQRISRALACGSLAVIGLAAGCTPQEVQIFKQLHPTHQNAVLASMRSQTVPASNVPSDAALQRLAKCESGGNPRARSRSGRYTGLYQFDRSTWNSLARQVLPSYVGVTPGDAPANIQDAMARALYRQRGRSPWPHCGRRI